jgi:FAD synthetase
MRINPLLEWSCKDIWQYLLENHVPYCSLYDIGYTSIGNMKNTAPNPHLMNDDQLTFRPAYQLENDEFERAGRN